MKIVVWMAYHLESREIVDNYISLASSYLVQHNFVICEDLESIKREIVDADIMLGWRITPEVFAEAKKLKWIQFGSAGIDHTVFPELINSNVILTTLSGIHTVPVAEHVLAMMLSLIRRLDIAQNLQNNKDYQRSQIAATSSELSGKTIGIIGLGKIGLNIARLAKAFDMRVIGTKRTIESELPCVDKVYESQDLYKILPVSDFLVMVVPLTSGTQALIGRLEINLMKDGAYLINVARGAMLDNEALRDALSSGKLAGAALDVFPQEPIPKNSPIWDLPNTIITPHTAGSSPRYGDRAANIFKTNLDAFLRGRKMINVFDRNRGY